MKGAAHRGPAPGVAPPGRAAWPTDPGSVPGAGSVALLTVNHQQCCTTATGDFASLFVVDDAAALRGRALVDLVDGELPPARSGEPAGPHPVRLRRGDGSSVDARCWLLDHDDGNRTLVLTPVGPTPTLSQTLVGNLPGMAYRLTSAPLWRAEFLSDGCLELTGHAPREV